MIIHITILDQYFFLTPLPCDRSFPWLRKPTCVGGPSICQYQHPIHHQCPRHLQIFPLFFFSFFASPFYEDNPTSHFMSPAHLSSTAPAFFLQFSPDYNFNSLLSLSDQFVLPSFDNNDNNDIILLPHYFCAIFFIEESSCHIL